MVTIIYRDGRCADFPFQDEPPEYQLALACYMDDVERVRTLLDRYPSMDLDAAVIHSKSRGNGTSLVLCGCVEIARLLVEHGADVNRVYFNGSDSITPLDSARKELTKYPVRTDSERAASIINLIKYLDSIGGRSAVG
jgi:hypothetical protein